MRGAATPRMYSFCRSGSNWPQMVEAAHEVPAAEIPYAHCPPMAGEDAVALIPVDNTPSYPGRGDAPGDSLIPRSTCSSVWKASSLSRTAVSSGVSGWRLAFSGGGQAEPTGTSTTSTTRDGFACSSSLFLKSFYQDDRCVVLTQDDNPVVLQDARSVAPLSGCVLASPSGSMGWNDWNVLSTTLPKTDLSSCRLCVCCSSCSRPRAGTPEEARTGCQRNS